MAENEIDPVSPATDAASPPVQGPAPDGSLQPEAGQGRPYSLGFLAEVPGGLMEDQRQYIEANLGEFLRKQDAKVTQVLQQSSAKAAEAEKALQGIVQAAEDARTKDPVRHRAFLDVLEGNYGSNGAPQAADPISELAQRSKSGQKVSVSDFGAATRQLIQSEFKTLFQQHIQPLVQTHVSEIREQKVSEALRSEPRVPSDNKAKIVEFLSRNPNMTPNQAIYALYGPELVSRAQRETTAQFMAGGLMDDEGGEPEGERKQFASSRAAGEAAYRETMEKLRTRRAP